MITQLVILVAAFACVAAFTWALAAMFTSKSSSEVEDRLDALTAGGSKKAKGGDPDRPNLLNQALEEGPGLAETVFANFFDIRRFLSQADVALTPSQFCLLIVGLAALGGFGCTLAGVPLVFAPLAAGVLGATPWLYVFVKRKRRIGAFARQLPDALELISRALRAGHSLAAGFNLVGDEMAEPIRREFARVYEEQNLGIPLEEALECMTERVPNLDLRFFATAVVLQRQTGGDLAEILDKIGHLVRERFNIFGQIQALTGEGRLSGIVLLALPPILFVVMYRLNPDYVMLLFNDPIGQWLLGGAIALQLIGAVVIKKIITIKV